VVAPRLHAYEKQTAPLVSFYRRLNSLDDIDATKSVEEVQQQVADSVERIRGTR
jgi:adenylate kinase family enzyme